MRKLRPYQQETVKECWQALKANNEPVLLMSSVGSGKSLILADILQTMERHNKRALCLVNNAELVRNNSETLLAQGTDSSIYCAALGFKDVSKPIVFGTPQSVLNGINKNEKIAYIKWNLIVVDEAHNINYNNPSTCFMRILRHYKQEYPNLRVLGATGTAFRFKGSPIVGRECLFKTQVGNITTEQLIKENYLINPYFEIDENLVLDFSRVRVKQNGLFDQKELQSVIEKSARLTELICKQVIHIMQNQNRLGVFIFATTKKHAYEIMSHLPIDESALILGDTPHDERGRIIDAARIGKLKFLVNISIFSVGIDIPAFDTIAYLRPTESLVLLVQTMGRALRLSPDTNKQEALILDFAGNIERHRDWDNPLLLKAVAQTIDKDKPLVILCPSCSCMNTEHARRCVGLINDKRCDYYFEFKECPNELCKVKNDIATRHCRVCEAEIIDPNEKLTLDPIKTFSMEVHVLEARYNITGTEHGFRLNCEYACQDKAGNSGIVREHYSPTSEKACRVFYGNFVRKHCDKPSEWYMHLNKRYKIEQMLQCIKTPSRLTIVPDSHGSRIKNRYFD